jgi:PAS domain S-box-containing protein
MIPFKSSVLNKTMVLDIKKESINDVASRLQAIIETAVDGIIAISDRGLIESVNPATCKIFGYEVEEMLGQNVSMLMPQPHKHNHDGYINNYTTSGERKIIGIGREVPGRKKDGTVFPFWLAVSEFKLGEKRMFTGVVHDMTEQKKAETALRELNQELESMVSERTEKLSDVVNKLLASNQQLQHEIQERKAVAHALLMSQEEVKQTANLLQQIVYYFPDGTISVADRNLNYLFTGGELHRLFNTNPQDLIGKRLFHLMSDEKWAEIKLVFERVFEGESVLDYEFPERIRNQDLVFDAVPLKEPDGSINKIAIFTRTITNLKRVEADLRDALKKEQELGMLKSRFVSMASHEFRTPLSTILSSASLMIQYIKEEQQDKREKHFQKIRSSVDMLTTILNDFLSLSRLEEGRVEVAWEEFNIQDFCKETMDDAQTIIKQGQTLKLHHPPIPLMVYLDKKLLKLIFINLISNASKYSDDAAEINCAIKLEKNELHISITDAGIGIPEEEQKHLFDRFFRASNATNIKGTGLGLHIVKRYAELMNGTVSFESIFGKGSTFTLNFDRQNA